MAEPFEDAAAANFVELRSALAIFPYDPSAFQCAVLLHLELGQPAEAETWLKKLRPESTSESAHAILATLQALLAAAQNKPRARRLLARCQSEIVPKWLRAKAEKTLRTVESRPHQCAAYYDGQREGLADDLLAELENATNRIAERPRLSPHRRTKGIASARSSDFRTRSTSWN